MVRYNKWTDEQAAELRRLWEGEVPVLDIMRALDMNHNQVVGKAFRMRLTRRQHAPGAQLRPRKREVEIKRKREMWVVEPLLVRTCQYPHGDPRKPGFHFCGSLVVPGKPYCEAHCAVTYTVYRTKKEAQRALEREIGGALKAIEREAREMEG